MENLSANDNCVAPITQPDNTVVIDARRVAVAASSSGSEMKSMESN
jgi:hypothetical protein